MHDVTVPFFVVRAELLMILNYKYTLRFTCDDNGPYEDPT